MLESSLTETWYLEIMFMSPISGNQIRMILN